MADFPEQAGFHDLPFRLNEMWRALALRADLHHAFMLARRIEHGLAFEHIATDRFLTIHVGARFHRGDGVQRVPVVRRTDQDDIEVLLL